MGWFSNKPAFVALCPFLAGLVFAYYFNIPFLPLCVVALVLPALAFIFHSKKYIVQLLLILLLYMIGCLHLESRSFESGPNSIQHFADLPYTVTVEGLVLKPAEKSGRSWTTIIRADSVWVLGAGYRTQGLCLLKIYEKPDIHYGDKIVSKGQLRLPAGQRNPGAFNYKKYLAAQNIHAVLRVVSSEHIVRLDGDDGRPILARAVYSVRKFVLSVIDSSLSDQPAALLKALLVGARGDLDEELLPAFANVGVIHVLAVSGLHVGFILAGLLGFLRFLRIPDPARLFIVIIGLIFYAHLTGLKPSVVRATIMAVVYLVGLLLQRRAHLLNTLAVAAFIILVRRPLELFEPGFQLSFMAVAGIIFIYDRLSKLLRTRTKRLRDKGQVLPLFLLNLFFVSVAAQIATIPLTVYYFHRLSLIAFFAKMITSLAQKEFVSFSKNMLNLLSASKFGSRSIGTCGKQFKY